MMSNNSSENIISVDSDNAVDENAENSLVAVSNEMLADARKKIEEGQVIELPITQLATLGAGISSLIPSLRTINQTITMNTGGLYKRVGDGVGDELKSAGIKTFWGASKNALSGVSKMAKFEKVETITGASSTRMPFNPGTIMIAAAFYSIEKQLGEISETGKEILSFLETEKESEIEADVETLTAILTNYKFNWDNSHYVESNHKMVLDIQRTARKNMLSYKKSVTKVIESVQLISSQSKINAKYKELEKKFKYFRLSLYTFSMASLLEIMLGGNNKEEYISGIRNEIFDLSKSYRDIFCQSSVYLEKLRKRSLETNILKGFGKTSRAVGNFIGKIPLVKNGQADEYLQKKGDEINNSVTEEENKTLALFGQLSNPKPRCLWRKWMILLKYLTILRKFFLMKTIFILYNYK